MVKDTAHTGRFLFSRFLRTFVASALSLTLTLPSPALALRQVGLEENPKLEKELADTLRSGPSSSVTAPTARLSITTGLEEALKKPVQIVWEGKFSPGMKKEDLAPLANQATFNIGEKLVQTLQLPLDSPVQFDSLWNEEWKIWHLALSIRGIQGELDLYHVFENAVDALADLADETGEAIDGQIRMTVQKEESALILEVEDNGRGISRKELDDLFLLVPATKVPGTRVGGKRKALAFGVYHNLLYRHHNGSLEFHTRYHANEESWRLTYDPTKHTSPKVADKAPGTRQARGTTVRWRFDEIFSTAGLEERKAKTAKTPKGPLIKRRKFIAGAATATVGTAVAGKYLYDYLTTPPSTVFWLFDEHGPGQTARVKEKLEELKKRGYRKIYLVLEHAPVFLQDLANVHPDFARRLQEPDDIDRLVGPLLNNILPKYHAIPYEDLQAIKSGKLKAEDTYPLVVYAAENPDIIHLVPEEVPPEAVLARLRATLSQQQASELLYGDRNEASALQALERFFEENNGSVGRRNDSIVALNNRLTLEKSEEAGVAIVDSLGVDHREVADRVEHDSFEKEIPPYILPVPTPFGRMWNSHQKSAKERPLPRTPQIRKAMLAHFPVVDLGSLLWERGMGLNEAIKRASEIFDRMGDLQVDSLTRHLQEQYRSLPPKNPEREKAFRQLVVDWLRNQKLLPNDLEEKLGPSAGLEETRTRRGFLKTATVLGAATVLAPLLGEAVGAAPVSHTAFLLENENLLVDRITLDPSKEKSLQLFLTGGSTGLNPDALDLEQLVEGYRKVTGVAPIVAVPGGFFDPRSKTKAPLGTMLRKQNGQWDVLFLNIPHGDLALVGTTAPSPAQEMRVKIYPPGMKLAYRLIFSAQADGAWTEKWRQEVARVNVPAEGIAVYKHPSWRYSFGHAQGVDVVAVPRQSLDGKRGYEIVGVLRSSTGKVPIPRHGLVLSLPGKVPKELEEVLQKGIRLDEEIFVPDLLEEDGVVQAFSAGQEILRGGTIAPLASEHGFQGGTKQKIWKGGVSPKRTILALTHDNKVLLLILRRPKKEGRRQSLLDRNIFVWETVHLLQKLGAVDAVELDAGGSQGLWYRGQLVYAPERKLPWALLIVPDLPKVLTTRPTGLEEATALREGPFQRRVKVLLQARELMQKGLVARLKVHKDTISHDLSGRHNPTRRKIFTYAKALRVSPILLETGFLPDKEIYAAPQGEKGVEYGFGTADPAMAQKLHEALVQAWKKLGRPPSQVRKWKEEIAADPSHNYPGLAARLLSANRGALNQAIHYGLISPAVAGWLRAEQKNDGWLRKKRLADLAQNLANAYDELEELFAVEEGGGSDRRSMLRPPTGYPAKRTARIDNTWDLIARFMNRSRMLALMNESELPRHTLKSKVFVASHPEGLISKRREDVASLRRNRGFSGFTEPTVQSYAWHSPRKFPEALAQAKGAQRKLETLAKRGWVRPIGITTEGDSRSPEAFASQVAAIAPYRFKPIDRAFEDRDQAILQFLEKNRNAAQLRRLARALPGLNRRLRGRDAHARDLLHRLIAWRQLKDRIPLWRPVSPESIHTLAGTLIKKLQAEQKAHRFPQDADHLDSFLERFANSLPPLKEAQSGLEEREERFKLDDQIDLRNRTSHLSSLTSPLLSPLEDFGLYLWLFYQRYSEFIRYPGHNDLIKERNFPNAASAVFHTMDISYAKQPNLGGFSTPVERRNALSYYLYGKVLPDDALYEEVERRSSTDAYLSKQATVVFFTIKELAKRTGGVFTFDQLLKAFRQEAREADRVAESASPYGREKRPEEDIPEEQILDLDAVVLRRALNIVLGKIPSRHDPSGLEEQAPTKTFIVVGPTAFEKVSGLKEAVAALRQSRLSGQVIDLSGDVSPEKLAQLLMPVRKSPHPLALTFGLEEDPVLAQAQRMLSSARIPLQNHPPQTLLPLVRWVNSNVGRATPIDIERAAEEFLSAGGLEEAA